MSPGPAAVLTSLRVSDTRRSSLRAADGAAFTQKHMGQVVEGGGRAFRPDGRADRRGPSADPPRVPSRRRRGRAIEGNK